ncbi:MAG: outer membrane protein assembly factor BamA [Bradymonadales bacterium]|nr:outer membrane protein assembly factor BamA [Bradymonadales bacterium]
MNRTRKPWLWMPLAVLVLTGLPSTVVGQGLEPPPIPSGPVVEIQVVGTRRVEPQAVRNILGTRRNQPTDRAQIRRDISAILSLRTRTGTPYFEDVQVDIEQTAQGVIVTYILRERPVLVSVDYRFVLDDELKDDITEVVDLEPGDVFDLSRVRDNVRKIEELYREKGYYLAQVDYEWTEVEEGDVRLTMVITEYDEVEVRRVHFLGNERLTDEQLRSVIATRPGDRLGFLTGAGVFNEVEFANDRRRLRAYYYDFGHIDVEIGEPQVELSRDLTEIYITIPIVEGPQYFISEVGLSGDLLEPAPDLMERFIRLASGDSYSSSGVRADVERLSTYYKDLGYANVNVNLVINRDATNRQVNVIYDVQQGDLVYISRIIIRGNKSTRDQVIRREMRIHESDLYSITNIRRSRARIERLGFFETVELREIPTADPQLMDLEVTVSERPTGQFNVGAGFSSVENFIFMATIAHNNLLGRGQNLALQASLSSIRTIFSLGFTEPYFFGTRWQFGFEIFNRQLVYTDFTRSSMGFSLTVGHPITDDVTMSATYQLENVEVEPGGRSGRRDRQIANLFTGGLTSSILGAVYWDTRNNRLFPSRGFLQSASAEIADQYLASENEFIRFRLGSYWYFTLFADVVLKANAIVGFITSTDPNQPVPIFERFFLGGPNSVRGFERASLSPTQSVAYDPSDPDSYLVGFPIGGDKELIFTVEIEFPIIRALGLRGVLFADAGNAFGEGDPFSLTLDFLTEDRDHYYDVLRTAVGLGFRWMSPMGPLRFEWGFPLSPLPGEETSVFEFSVTNIL